MVKKSRIEARVQLRVFRLISACYHHWPSQLFILGITHCEEISKETSWSCVASLLSRSISGYRSTH